MAKIRVSATTSAYFWGCSSCNKGGVEFSEGERDHQSALHKCPRPRGPRKAKTPEPKA